MVITVSKYVGSLEDNDNEEAQTVMVAFSVLFILVKFEMSAHETFELNKLQN